MLLPGIQPLGFDMDLFFVQVQAAVRAACRQKALGALIDLLQRLMPCVVDMPGIVRLQRFGHAHHLLRANIEPVALLLCQ